MREATRERFRHVLVDEFQDTNRLQCELIDLVCAPDAETFFVGDEFQSIYRFRHADVQVFIDRRSAAAGHVALRDNYRSRPEVLQFVNDLFGRVFGDEYRALEASRRFEGAAFEYPVELLVVDRSEASGAAEWRAAEADLIAERVAAVLEDGEHEPGDVVVLLRSGTDVETYEQALRARGLETHRAIGRGYYGRQQVIDLCAYLRLVRNRYDDHALLAVLASPIVGVSNDGLLRVRRAAKYSLYGALERTFPPGLGPARPEPAAGLPPALRPDRRGLRRGRPRGAVRADRLGPRLRPRLPGPARRQAALRERAGSWCAWRASTRRCAGPTSPGSCTSSTPRPAPRPASPRPPSSRRRAATPSA